MKNFFKLLVPSLAVLFFTGCVTKQPTTMYCHNHAYTKSMYYYLQNEPNYDDQLKLMEKYFNIASETNTLPAPGAYAHMAMLYSKIGNDVEAIKYLNMEKEAFPESAHYIDFLLQKKKVQE